MIDESKVLEYLTLLINKHKAMYAKNYPNLKPPTFNASFGKKYIKVIVHDSQTSVHCFIDYDGNLYKPASFKVPAKGIRGNISQVNPPIFCGDFYIKR